MKVWLDWLLQSSLAKVRVAQGCGGAALCWWTGAVSSPLLNPARVLCVSVQPSVCLLAGPGHGSTVGCLSFFSFLFLLFWVTSSSS